MAFAQLSDRLFKANKFIQSHDFNDYDSYGVMIDVNNMYGGILEKFPLRWTISVECKL